MGPPGVRGAGRIGEEGTGEARGESVGCIGAVCQLVSAVVLKLVSGSSSASTSVSLWYVRGEDGPYPLVEVDEDLAVRDP